MGERLQHAVFAVPYRSERREGSSQKWHGLVTRFTLDDLFDPTRVPTWLPKSPIVLVRGLDHQENRRKDSPRKILMRDISMQGEDKSETALCAEESPSSSPSNDDDRHRWWGGDAKATKHFASKSRPFSARHEVQQKRPAAQRNCSGFH